jgi:hypothetical protein
MRTRISNRSRSFFQILIPVVGTIAIIFGWYFDHLIFYEGEEHFPAWIIIFFIFALLYVVLVGIMADVKIDSDYLYYRYLFKTRKIELNRITKVIKGFPLSYNPISITKWIVVKYLNQEGKTKRIIFQSEGVSMHENLPQYPLLEELMKRINNAKNKIN